MPEDCPFCKKKYSNYRNYIKHLEREHKNALGCGCGMNGGDINLKKLEKRKILNDDFDEKIDNIRNNLKKIQTGINMNAITYDLKLGKKDLESIPLPIREKIKHLVLENEFLKGNLHSQEQQINLMKRQINKCIDNIGVHLRISE